jgi:hypothetical protein
MRLPLIEEEPWHKWYAWRPVIAYTMPLFDSWPGTSYLVWLEHVWRTRRYRDYKWRTIYHPVDSPYIDRGA